MAACAARPWKSSGPYGNLPACVWHARILQRAAFTDIQAEVDHFYGADRLNAQKTGIENARQYFHSRMFETARTLYAKALDLQPGNWALIEEIATLLLVGSGENEEAIDMCDAGLAINPLATGIWRTKGESLLALDRIDEAQAAVNRAIELSPGNSHDHRLMVQLALKYEDIPAALQAGAHALAYKVELEDREILIALRSDILTRFGALQHQKLLAKTNQFRMLVDLPEP